MDFERNYSFGLYEESFPEHIMRDAVENATPATDEEIQEPKSKTKVQFTEEIDAAILNEEIDLRELAFELDCEVDVLMNRWFKLKKPNTRKDAHLPPSQKKRPFVRSYKKRAPRSDRRPDPYTMRDKSLKEQLAQAVAMKKDREELAMANVNKKDFSKARTVQVDKKTVVYAEAGETDEEAIAKYERNQRNRINRNLNFQLRAY